MKTAISIPDNVFEEADFLAKKLGISRSELYTKAIKQFLSENRQEDITAAINKACELVDTSMDPILMQMQMMSLPVEEW